MTPERWQQISEVFQTAVELPPKRRAAFLDQACTTDDALRSEVESLLSSDEEEWELIEQPALERAAPLLASERLRLEPGQRVGHYEVIQLLGKGGMGEVYLARDDVLHRRVALKLLPADYTKNKHRLGRFQQEARAASSLNHPNIFTIHELGEIDGHPFIATEFVEGETLRERLKCGSLPISEALEIAMQVAGALAAAHKAGIVHRDIKPENIMLRPDGYVKVLDFGLAKLTEQYEPISAGISNNLEMSSGFLMGTAKYMSPEQASGLSVDHRSDIFSLGVMLYEMITGRPPFEGKTAKEIVTSIQIAEPSPLNVHLPDPNGELQRVLDRALRKEPNHRYQAISELAADLKELQHEIELRTVPQRWIQPFNRKDLRVVIPTVAAIIVLLVGGGFGLYKLVERTRPTATRLQTMSVFRLTTSGRVIVAAISPNGKHVAYVSEASGQQSIYVKDLTTASDVRIVEPIQTGKVSKDLTFSVDGNYVYYCIRNAKTTGISLFRVSIQGGESSQIIADIDSPVTFSPDGNRLAFARHNNPVVGESNLLMADADGTHERIISTRKVLDGFISPAWSPDGKLLACAVGLREPSSLVVMPVEGGEAIPVSSQKWRLVDRLSWASDGAALVLTAQDRSSSQLQVWQVSYPSGEVRRVTNDLNSYTGMSVTADSNKMAIVQSALQSDLWIMPGVNTGRAMQITSGAGRDEGSKGFSWIANGSLVYVSNASGNLDLWSIDADGSDPRQLTSNAGQNYEPAVTPDGRYIVFVSDRGGARNLWRMNVDGTEPMRLTTGNEHFPSISADSRWIVYTAPDNSGTPTLWRIGIDGGQPLQLTDKWVTTPAISQDGKWIAVHYWAYQSAGPPVFISLFPFEGGQIVNVGPLGDTALFRWTPDGSAVAYVDDKKGISNIRTIQIDGSPSNQLTDFKSDQIFWFDWSRDGKQLALARGAQTTDVVLISDFK